MKFIKGKKLFLKGMPFRNIIIAFFAHWTGYASDGWKTGISSNPTAGRIENYLCQHYPEWMDGYYDNGLHMKLIHKVMDICEKTYNPPSAAPIYVRKQMQLAWPKVEKFLETTPLINDNAEFVENTRPQWESMKKTITFKELKKLIKESAEDNAPSWYDVPGTKWIWNGEWADAEVEYDGEIINANELEDYAWDKYRKECEEKGTVPSEEEFDDKLPVSWFKKTLDEFMFDRYGEQ